MMRLMPGDVYERSNILPMLPLMNYSFITKIFLALGDLAQTVLESFAT